MADFCFSLRSKHHRRGFALRLTPISAIITVFCLINSALAAEVVNPEMERDLLRARIGSLTLEAEQLWPQHTPKDNLIAAALSIVRFFDSGQTRAEQVPAEYRPENQNFFVVPEFQVPIQAVNFACAHADQQSCLQRYQAAGDVAQFRFPVLPLELSRNRALQRHLQQNNYLRLSDQLIATPTSSTRSVLIRANTAAEPIRVLKLSMSVETSGSSRVIRAHHIVQATNASAVLRDFHRRSEGLTSSGVRWNFRSEDFGAILRDLDHGGFIERIWPEVAAGYQRVPAYGLNHLIPSEAAAAAEPARLIDYLFQRSGYESRVRFIWEKLVEPFWLIMLEAGFVHGLPLTIHGQNVGFTLTPNGAIDSVWLQDLSVPFEPKIRWFQGLPTVHALPAWANTEMLGASSARQALQESFANFRLLFLRNVIGLALNSSDLEWIEGRLTDSLQQFSVRRFNFYPRNRDHFLENFSKTLRDLDRMGIVVSSVSAENSALVSVNNDSTGENFIERATRPLAADRPAARAAQVQSYRQLGRETFVPGETILLATSEVTEIQRGVSQRLRAIAYFLNHYRQDPLAAAEKSGIPIVVLEALVDLNHLRRYLNNDSDTAAIDPITIFAGADFMRDSASRRWVLIEDQISPIPGSPLYQEITRRQAEQFLAAGALGDLPSIYQSYQNYATQALGLSGPARIAILDYHSSAFSQVTGLSAPEASRSLATEAQFLAEVPGYSLVTTDVFDEVGRSLEQITGIRLFSGTNQVHRRDPISRRIRRMANGELRTQGVSSEGRLVQNDPIDLLLNRIYRDHLGAVHPEVELARRERRVLEATHPLATMAGSKLFQSYVPELIRAYLLEEPILSAPETTRFVDSAGLPDTAAIRTIFSEIESYVVKRTDGFGGRAVYFGSELISRPEQIRNLERAVVAEPLRYIAQKVIQPSVVFLDSTQQAHRVHIRFFSAVIGTAAAPWIYPAGFATMSPLDSLRTNLTSNRGRSLLALVLPDCEQLAMGEGS